MAENSKQAAWVIGFRLRCYFYLGQRQWAAAYRVDWNLPGATRFHGNGGDFRGRIHLVPRYRQRRGRGAFDVAHAMMGDDP